VEIADTLDKYVSRVLCPSSNINRGNSTGDIFCVYIEISYEFWPNVFFYRFTHNIES